MKFLIALLFPALVLATPSSQREIIADHIKNGSGRVNMNASGIFTIPNATDTGVGKATTDTLTNKTINGSSNTISNISLTSMVSGILPLTSGGTNNSSLGADAGGVYYSDGTKIVNLAHGTSGNVLTSGGTGAPTWTATLTNPMSTGGDIIYGGASGTPTRLANGSAGQLLASAGGTSAPVWTSNLAPTVQAFYVSTGYYTFTITAGNTAAVGSTWTNNTKTFTLVYAMGAGDTTIVASGTGAPSASGTLTYASGTHTGGNITYSANAANGTYRTPAGVLYLKVKVIGGGGGGGAVATNAGANGTSSTFGSSLLTAANGLGGSVGNSTSTASGDGGACTINGPAINITNVAGGRGTGGGATTHGTGGAGGNNFLGGAGGGGGDSVAGYAAKSGSGGGGGGAGSNSASSGPAPGGGAGCSLEAIIASPSATYIFTVGAGGIGGAAGTIAGGNGGDGQVEVTEFYQ